MGALACRNVLAPPCGRRCDSASQVARPRNGQATRRHPGEPAESCFLPDLTRFTGSRRAGPVHATGEPPRRRSGRSLVVEGAQRTGTLAVPREGCESGRIGTLGKRVWGNPPWVRIPLPPRRREIDKASPRRSRLESQTFLLDRVSLKTAARLPARCHARAHPSSRVTRSGAFQNACVLKRSSQRRWRTLVMVSSSRGSVEVWC
jgi:hypothetical protein